MGSSNQVEAVQPLCDVLDDDSALVRQAVVAALRKLARPEAVQCLRVRKPLESKPDILSEIDKAIQAYEVAEVKDVPKFVPTARNYVAIDVISDKTGRVAGDVPRIVKRSLREALESSGLCQVAPSGETTAAAKQVLTKRKLKGYLLMPTAEKPNYADGLLQIRVRVAVLTYPGKALLADIPSGFRQSARRVGDISVENELFGEAAKKAGELFVQQFR